MTENLLNATASKILIDLAFMVARLQHLESCEPKSDERRTLHQLIEKRRNMLFNVKRQLNEISPSSGR
jgi:hypothetical protein